MDDPVLERALVALVEDELANPEVAESIQDLGVDPGRLHETATSMIDSLLVETPQEYQQYKHARAQHEVTVEEYIGTAANDPWSQLLAVVWPLCGAIAVCLLVVRALVSVWWEPWAVLAEVAWLCVFLALLAAGVRKVRTTRLGARIILNGDPVARQLAAARTRLIGAISSSAQGLTQVVRYAINDAREDRLERDYAVQDSTGLRDLHGSDYYVPTSVWDDIEALLAGMNGGSVGIAGVRGTGKSALIRQYCATPQKLPSHVTCLVSAPVDYSGRDFVLHLFAEVCRASARRFRNPHRTWRQHRRWSSPRWLLYIVLNLVLFLGLAAGLIWVAHLDHLLSAAVILLIQAVIGLFLVVSLVHDGHLVYRRHLLFATERRLCRRALRDLARIRFLQTNTTGWSGAIKLGVGLEAQASGGWSRAEQPLSYPEIVAEFRAFTRAVARYLSRTGASVYIGVDELDKIGSATQVEKFLNEVKGIFGIPGVYFLVSVSDDAMTAFERRGFPFRDVFDSSFDEILRVSPLTYAESRRLLYQRVIGLNEPYVGLCHVLAGGQARDLIRIARRLVRLGNPQTKLSELCLELVGQELHRKALATLHHPAVQNQPNLLRHLHHLTGVVEEVVPPLADILTTLSADPLDDDQQAGETRLEFACYVYFCMTLLQVFNDALDKDHMDRATQPINHPATFDRLAKARTAFAVNPHLAWQLIDDFRKAWPLPLSPSPAHTRP
ncbi:hypothetical protein ACFWYW_56065 [Nonomuraea sp. NPDC059023]|uniref:hypothetical protein n=1 Tax=unclassified Nonomuraea TaxID=2593643 RepID=UPI0036C3E670